MGPDAEISGAAKEANVSGGAWPLTRENGHFLIWVSCSISRFRTTRSMSNMLLSQVL